MLIMITYDLNKVKDYPKLYKALGELGETKRDPTLESVWFINTSYSYTQIQNHLLANIDKDDKVFFCRVNPGQYDGWLNKDVWTWITTHAR